jgi:phosphoglycerate dehydrogenase-like enzyme
VTEPGGRPRVVVLTTEQTPVPSRLAAWAELADVTLSEAAELPATLPGADVLLLWDFLSTALREHWASATALRWVHVAAAGVDAALFPELRRSDVVVTNSAGVFDRPVAEFVLAAVLAHDKKMHVSGALQRERRWVHREVAPTAGGRALVVGTGGIGRATARLLRAVDVEVRGAGRIGRRDDPDFGLVVSTDELVDHVGWADHVVLVAPLTPATHHLVGADVLSAMKPGAHLVNVGRGALVDEPALVDGLRTGTPAFATLDVFEEEPLPRDSPLWALPNVAVSAHMCGDVVGWRDRLAELFEDNLGRYVHGATLRNVVDLELGYPGTDRGRPEGASTPE